MSRSSVDEGESKPALAYVLQMFPGLTMTFIYREVLALRAAGFRVYIFSNHRPSPERLSLEARPLVDETRYFYPIRWRRICRAHVRFLLSRPLRYLGTLVFVLTRPRTRLGDRWRTLRHFAGAVTLAAEIPPEVRHLHAHFAIHAATFALVIARLLGLTFSFTAHNIVFTERVLLREKLRLAAFVIAISEDTRRYLLDYEGDPRLADRIHVVHCGVDPDVFPPAKTEPGSIMRIVSVGQLAARKGLHVLIDACGLLARGGVAFICCIAGDGPERARLEALIENSGLGDIVHLRGAIFQEDLRDFLSGGDVFVLPCVVTSDGDRDGIPVSLMEAMAMELPCISTPVSGIPELIRHGESGLLVKPDSAEALAEAIQRLAGDPALRARIGRAARQRIVEAFNLHRTTAQLADQFTRYHGSHE